MDFAKIHSGLRLVPVIDTVDIAATLEWAIRCVNWQVRGRESGCRECIYVVFEYILLVYCILSKSCQSMMHYTHPISYTLAYTP